MKRLTFSRMGKNGRLANSFFMLASCYGLAKRSGRELFMPEWSYQDYFDYKVKIGERVDSRKDVLEPGFHYCGNVFDITLNSEKDTISIAGYLQSERYFNIYRDEIKNIFRFKPSVVDRVKAPHIQLFYKPVIALHIRRGDFVNNPNYHNLPINYFILALEKYFPHWDTNYNILVFSDDIAYCKAYITGDNVFYSEENSAIEDMCLLSQCNHFILSNSSYSWWGAWLGEKEDSVIVRPAQLFEGELKKCHNTEDFWPERWIEFNYEGNKIDLKDCTFLIPVHYDHQDRRDNIYRVIKHLRDNFDTNIIVGEQGSNAFTTGEYPYIYDYILFTRMNEFHRTWMLNKMCYCSETPIIINYDADVIIPTIQLLLGAKAIRKGVCMVYPYDGRFARIPKDLQHKDISELFYMSFVGARGCDPISVGGCVMFDKKQFIKGGMENENFISYGPEDTERYERFKKLGYLIYRTKGTLYHLDHYIGSNSSGANPHFGRNCEEESKIKNMTREELEEYVKTWKWIKNIEKIS